ncbi:MAG TPA: ATP-binding cassette domain-containing protein [Methylocystis sp.]|nr:ATP-binding cassette domain-containing protein [Methylocystis sp.]
MALRKVSHWYGDGESRKQVLFDMDLDVASGEIVMLMGPSGCGKTTLLTLAGALRSVQQGSVSFCGREMAGASTPVQLETRRQIGFIFQAHNLHNSLTAIQNVRASLEVHGPSELKNWRARCEETLARVGLADKFDSYPEKLSGGQKLRVAVARALVAQPRLVLADEATAALDRRSGRDVTELLRKLAREQGSAVLMVTHDNRILDIADRIVEMEDGRILSSLP